MQTVLDTLALTAEAQGKGSTERFLAMERAKPSRGNELRGR